MRSVSLRLVDLQKTTIPIGYVDENLHTQVRFDCKKIFEEYPSAIPSLAVCPPVGETYPAIVTREGDFVIWDVTASDVIADGAGEIQLTFVEDEVVAKSYVCRIRVNRSLEASATAPEPIENWVTRANIVLAEIPQTITESIDEAFGAITAEASTLTPGSQATAAFDSETKVLSIGVPEGLSGEDGYSPVRGVDYWTAADQQAMREDIATDLAAAQAAIAGDKADALTAIGSAGTTQVGNVNTAGTTQVGNVNTAGVTQVGAVQAKGAEVIASIPSDYSELSADVSDLKNEIDDKQDAPATAGTAGQVLGLDSNLDPVWVNQQGGGGGAVDDVKIDGTSILSQGVANIPIASTSEYGVVKVGSGLTTYNGALLTNPAGTSSIKAGTAQNLPIVPYYQQASVFYGLAKAAGDSTQSASSNPVGTYTDDAKSAISQMLDAPESVTGTTPTITAKAGVRYICGECSTLTIVAPESGCIDITFTSGTTPTVFSVSSAKTGVTAIRWANGFDPTSLDADTVYEINILDGEFGVVGSWT